MMVADDNSGVWSFDELVDDDDGNMCIDLQSIWKILDESPDPQKSNLEDISQEMVQQDDSAVDIMNKSSQSQTDLERQASLWVEPTQSVPLLPLQSSEALYFQKQIPEGYNSTVASNIPNGYGIHSFPVDGSSYASDFRVNMQQNYLKEETIFQDRHLEGDGFSQYKNQYLFEVDSSEDAKYKLIEDGVKDSVPPEDFSTSVEYDSFNHQAGAIWPHENVGLELFRDNTFSNDAILPEVSVGDSRGFFQVPVVSSATMNRVDAKLKCEEFTFSASGSENLSGVFSGRFPNGPFQTFPSTLPKISSNAQATSMNVMQGNVSRYLSSQMLPNVLTCCTNKKDMIQMAGDKQDTLLYSESGIHSLDIDGTHTRHRLIADSCSVDAMALEKSSMLTSIFRKHTHTKDENDSFNIQPWRNVTPFSELGCQKIQNDKLNNSSHFDNESDLYILEDDVEASYSTMSSVNRMSLIVPQASISGEPFNHSGTGSVRLKTNDEQLIFRAALQDLLQPKSEATPPDGLLAVPLLRHQRIALSWMVQKETASSNCSGGILADDQGLGKTVSTIALILTERSPSSSLQPDNLMQGQVETLDLDDDDCVTEVHGLKPDKQSSQVTPNGNGQIGKRIVGRPAAGTLIVCPTSVLRQWAEELNNKVTSKAKLSVLMYHGSNRTKDPIELAKYDIVLTTYSIVSMEVPKQPIADEDDEEAGKGDSFSSGMKRKYPSNSGKKYSKHKKEIETALLESAARPLARVGWFRVVLDEAQSIKNHRTQVARACWGLRAKRRWCLSGTPIQNSIDDIYSYFRFLRYEPYAVYKSFCSSIKVPITRNPKNGYKKLQAVLKTIMLRRTKGTFLDGEPIITLPPKSVQLTKVEFTKEEREFYSKLEADSRAQFEEYAAAGTVKKNYVNILLLLLRLRQACNHPLLVKENCNSSSLWRSSIEMAKKLPCEKQISLLNSFEASAICGICNLSVPYMKTCDPIGCFGSTFTSHDPDCLAFVGYIRSIQNGFNEQSLIDVGFIEMNGFGLNEQNIL